MESEEVGPRGFDAACIFMGNTSIPNAIANSWKFHESWLEAIINILIRGRLV